MLLSSSAGVFFADLENARASGLAYSLGSATGIPVSSQNEFIAQCKQV